MDILFTCTGIERKEKTLGNSNFKDHYPNANDNASFITMQPYIENATSKYVIKYLGRSFYADVVQWYQDADEAQTARNEIVRLCQRAIANYATYLAAPHMNVIVGNAGIGDAKADNVHSVPMWKYKSLRWACLLQGDETMDELTAQLERNIDHADLTNWVAAYEYTRYTTDLYTETKQLEEHVNIRGRRAYTVLSPSLKRAEYMLADILCDEYTDILTADTPERKHMIKLMRRYVAYMGLKIGIPHISMIIEGDGLFLVSSTDGYDTKTNASFTNDTNPAVAALLEQLDRDISQVINTMMSYISNNTEAFPKMVASEGDGTGVYGCGGVVVI